MMSSKKQTPLLNGVYIEATNGELFTSDKWTGSLTPNSVVVIQDEVRFRIALTQSSSTMRIHSSYDGALENYMTAIGEKAQALLDMKSAENTANIMKLQSGTNYAAGYCNDFTFPDGKTKGLLPALGWLQTAYDNKAEVDACLAACGATAMNKSTYHWTSTFWGVGSNGARYCWRLNWSGGNVGSSYLDTSYLIRPFATYGTEISTITIDQTNDDPATRVSGDINSSVIQWIRNNSHRVLAKKTANGVLTYCQLDDTDSTKYYDGTDAMLDGTQGDVFLKLPEFYYKGTEGDQVQIMFAKEQVDAEYIRWDPNTLIGVYEAYNGSSKMYSRSGVDSSGNSQSSWKTYAANRGTGYQLVDWQMHCVMGCLYYAMYGNTDCQSSIGKGTNAIDKSTGQTDSLGMTDTVAGGNGDSQSINFWGLENWWGNKYEYIHDYDNPANSLSATVNDPVNGGTRSLPIFFGYGGNYVKKMKFGRYLDLIATKDDPKNGSDTVGYCVWQNWPGFTKTAPRVIRRSDYRASSGGGVDSAAADDESTYRNNERGSRLAFRGSLIEETDVETFKAITITN